MQFVYPADLLEPRLPDELFRDEARRMAESGHRVALVNPEFALKANTLPPFSSLPEPDARTAYRSWMVTPTEYQTLLDTITRRGVIAATTLAQYLATHYLPNWYPLLADWTPETVVLDPADDLVAALTRLQQHGWSRFFVKDYVKSLKTAGGSAIERPEEIERVLAEMRKFRGTIEGGLCIRRYEAFVPNSEVRYFVIDGTAYAPDPNAPLPPIVRACAARLNSPFFSVDVAVRTDGTPRLVEVGDGQVSDLVGWTVDRFVSLWRGK